MGDDDDLKRSVEHGIACLEAWSEGLGPHANVRDISGALAIKMRRLWDAYEERGRQLAALTKSPTSSSD